MLIGHVQTSYGLLLSGYSMSIYYVACFHVAHKSFPVSGIHCILMSSKVSLRGIILAQERQIHLQFDHLVSSI